MFEVCNFAYIYIHLTNTYNILCSLSKELEIVFNILEIDFYSVLSWFEINSLKANQGEFQLMVLKTSRNNSFV